QMIEQNDPLRHPEWIVVTQADHTGSQLDAASALGGDCDKDLRRCDYFTAGRVMFANPRFVVAQRVEVLDEIKVTRQRESGILARRVKRGEEDAEPKPRAHTCSPGTQRCVQVPA